MSRLKDINENIVRLKGDSFDMSRADSKFLKFADQTGVGIYYSGGGCVHFNIDGVLINAVDTEIEYKLDQYTLETECYFGYWNGDTQYGFYATFYEGVEFLIMLPLKYPLEMY